MIGVELEDSISNAFYQKNMQKLCNKFHEESIKIFQQSLNRFQDQMNQNHQDFKNNRLKVHRRNLDKLSESHELYRNVKAMKNQQQDIQCRIADKYYQKKLKNKLFDGLRNVTYRNRYLYNADVQANRHFEKRVMKQVLKCWFQQVVHKNRNTIKLNTIQITNMEMQNMQKDYEEIIAKLENKLENKLKELEVVEQEHTLLFERYQDLNQNKEQLVASKY